VVGVLLVLLWPATTWWVEHVDGVKLHGKGALTGKDRQEVLDKARGRVTAVATGLLAAVHRRQRPLGPPDRKGGARKRARRPAVG
jgi:hypothetical protein